MSRTIPIPPSIRFHAGRLEPLETQVITESPVTLSVNGKKWLTFMCTPTDLEALAVGFLFNEGVIKRSEDLEVVEVCPSEENVDIWLKFTPKVPKHWRRTTGCTGGATSVAYQQLHHDLKDGALLTPPQLDNLLKDLIAAQVLYHQTGGVHTSILSDGAQVLVSAEDVGRHNTLDKIAGLYLLKNIKASRKILVTTGRISSDMIQKAAQIGASVVISRTSATSLSVSLAENWGITLIGYARPGQFTIYAHPERIDLQSKAVGKDQEENGA
jgi:FdhD protein